MKQSFSLLCCCLAFAACVETENDPEQSQQPVLCPAIYAPVCGDDGYTHANSCQANNAGASVLWWGMCADFDSDSCVGFADYLVLADHYGGPGSHEKGDATGDGKVQFDDFLILAVEFNTGLSCP